MKTIVSRLNYKVVAAVLALAGSALCLGTTLVGYEQVAAQAVVDVPVTVAAATDHKG
ncbi:hypothetical protein GCM10025771_09740 [Niveibacterium umoris]|uniref:Uncharacterized protein n=1 Tax=Niveibacterium umoris TaxID=1193620 RepID=A0A840BSZ4_9RHOO|nr:hypothetical protein [Niveibacterium umoris]MBB4013477.1 hypothetical protein [Niveibacterium umoris]